MEMLVAGKPNKVIAAEFDVSLRTVEFRRARVLRILDVRSVSEVVAVNSVRDCLAGQSNRPFCESADSLEVESHATRDFDLCPAWIHQSSTAAIPDVAAPVESDVALSAV